MSRRASPRLSRVGSVNDVFTEVMTSQSIRSSDDVVSRCVNARYGDRCDDPLFWLQLITSRFPEAQDDILISLRSIFDDYIRQTNNSNGSRQSLQSSPFIPSRSPMRGGGSRESRSINGNLSGGSSVQGSWSPRVGMTPRYLSPRDSPFRGTRSDVHFLNMFPRGIPLNDDERGDILVDEEELDFDDEVDDE